MLKVLKFKYKKEVLSLQRYQTLKCTSKGDKRFSSFYAKVYAFGKYDTIENHYQLCKRFDTYSPSTWADTQREDIPTHIELNGEAYPIICLEQWYKLLWIKYLEANKELAEYASKFNSFSDENGSKNDNKQAAIIEKYIKEGKDSLLKECEQLIKALETNKGEE